MNPKALWLRSAALLAIAAACGSSCSDAPSPCERVAQAVCARSCDCTNADTCNVTDPRGPLVWTRMFDDMAACIAMSTDYCEDNQLDADACLAAIDAAPCRSDVPEGGLVLPMSCLEP